MSLKTIFNKLKTSGELDKFNYLLTRDQVNNLIRKFIRDNKLIVTGARALNAQTNFPYQRATKDYDIFTRTKSKQFADKLKRILNEIRNDNYHYVKSSRHKGTYLLMDVGADVIKGTRDDRNIADFSKIPRKTLKTIEQNNMLFANLDELEKAKLRTLKFKKFTFRHKKDKADLDIIQKFKGGFFWI